MPAEPDNPGFSRPGEPLLNQIVRRVPIGGLTPGSGTFTEKPISGGGPPLNETLYEYNAELHLGKEFSARARHGVLAEDRGPGRSAAALPIDPAQPADVCCRVGDGTTATTRSEPARFDAAGGRARRAYRRFDLPAPIPEIAAPVWHFQDDAVTGRIVVNTAGPMGQIMPVIDQSEYRPTRYLPLADGPQQIGEFSKDLAFELYTIVPNRRRVH